MSRPEPVGGWAVRRLEPAAIVVGTVLVVALPTAVHGWPNSLRGNAFVALLIGAGGALATWRQHPRLASTTALGLLLVAGAVGGWFPDPVLAVFSASFAVLALGWTGRAAWVVAACAAAYLVVFAHVVDTNGWVAAVMFTLPPFAAGTALRMRRETASDLARRVQDLDDERELYATLAVRRERAQIASELHDIVGHALSVMVIQAAAGQRLVDSDPEAARDTLTAISESARRGTADLERLVEMLDGSVPGGADLTLVEEVVSRAGRTGLKVSCRLDGDLDVVSEPLSHLAFRIVQESLTNALRYAPGAEVRIVVTVDGPRQVLTVQVDNEPTSLAPTGLLGTGNGLAGLRDRVLALGGRFSAGGTRGGGWSVQARFPG